MSNIKDELLAIKQNDPLLQTQTVVDWARSHPTSALHGSLEWDDMEAAESWRNWQVRRLISVHVTDAEGSRQLVSLSIDRTKSGGGYRPIEDVLKQTSLRQVLLQDALNELERVRARYSAVQELAKVWEEADRVKVAKPRRQRGKVPEVVQQHRAA